MVTQRLDRGPADHRAGLATNEDVGRRVRDLDLELVRETHDPDPDEIGEVGQVPQALLERELGALGAPAEASDLVGDVLPFGAHGLAGAGACGEDVANAIERAASRERDSDGDCQGDGLRGHERDHEPIHEARIAHSLGRGGCRRLP